ncbi:MAG: hypothetical protein ACSHXD_15965 [Marinosulfonomonas sp.]
MNDFLASIDRKRLAINAIGYLIILVLFIASPMDGFMGQAITYYLWLFPIYFVIHLYIVYRRDRGNEE